MTANYETPTGLPTWIADHLAEIVSWGPAPVARGCFVPGCRRDAHLHGLCKTHHRRARRAWNPLPAEAGRARVPQSAGVVLTPDQVPTIKTTEEVN